MLVRRGPMTSDGTHSTVSVVIASVESARSIEGCVNSVRDAMARVPAEVIVVDASRDRSADIARAALGSDCVVQLPVGTLTPDLWAEGIKRSRGTIVALTTAHFEVQPSWLVSLVSAIDDAVVGASGQIELSGNAALTDWAVFYLRYSEFLSEPAAKLQGVATIPADNAAYEGDAVRRFVTTSHGFWEVEFHKAVQAAGRSLAVVPNARVQYGRSFPFRTIVTHRFHHGRHAGAWRAATGQRSAATIAIAAPAVPLALGVRVWRRVRGLPAHRGRFIRSLPVFLTLATAWAIGEAFGAVAGSPGSERPAPVPA